MKAIKLDHKSYQITLPEWVKYDKNYPVGQYFLPTGAVLEQFPASIFSILLNEAEGIKKSKCKQKDLFCDKVETTLIRCCVVIIKFFVYVHFIQIFYVNLYSKYIL